MSLEKIYKTLPPEFQALANKPYWSVWFKDPSPNNKYIVGNYYYDLNDAVKFWNEQPNPVLVLHLRLVNASELDHKFIFCDIDNVSSPEFKTELLNNFSKNTWVGTSPSGNGYHAVFAIPKDQELAQFKIDVNYSMFENQPLTFGLTSNESEICLTKPNQIETRESSNEHHEFNGESTLINPRTNLYNPTHVFNQQNSLEDILISNGCTLGRSGKYKHPNSSGNGGILVMEAEQKGREGQQVCLVFHGDSMSALHADNFDKGFKHKDAFELQAWFDNPADPDYMNKALFKYSHELVPEGEYKTVHELNIVAKHKPKPLPDVTDPLPPFPLHLLPAPLQQAAAEGSRFIKVAADAVATGGLSALSIAIGKSLNIVEREGHTVYSSLGFLVGMDTGERKSPIFDIMFRPLREAEEELKEKWEKYKHIAITKTSFYETQIKLKEKALDPNASMDENLNAITQIAELREELSNEEKKCNCSPQLYGSDITEQKLALNLYQQEGCYAVISPDAGGIVDNIQGKYSGKGESGESVYLLAMVGDEIRVERKGIDNPDFIINKTCLNVCLFLQPEKLKELAQTNRMITGGFLARFLCIQPARYIGGRDLFEEEKGLQLDKMADYNLLIKTIATYDGDAKNTIFTKDAYSKYVKFNNKMEARFNNDLKDSIAFTNKMVTTSVKLAVLLVVGSDKDSLLKDVITIDETTYSDAVELTEYYISNSVYVHNHAEQDLLILETYDLLEFIFKSKNKNKFMDGFNNISRLKNFVSKKYSNNLKYTTDLLFEYNWLIKVDDKICLHPDSEPVFIEIMRQKSKK